MQTTIVPFVRWIGGKRQLLSELIKHVPKTFSRYYEPFLGGGALFFYLQPQLATISDINRELIGTYQIIKQSFHRLYELLLVLQSAHCASKSDGSFYFALRDIERSNGEMGALNLKIMSPLLKAARFLYLNRAGFNGVYRVNASNHFNVPYGARSGGDGGILPVLRKNDFANLSQIAVFLRASKPIIKNVDFARAVATATPGDFIYFDPPYDYECGVNGFDAYSKGGFGRKGKNGYSVYVMNSIG